eukprot:901379-Pleurochrysis_carterae.AAC.1
MRSRQRVGALNEHAALARERVERRFVSLDRVARDAPRLFQPLPPRARATQARFRRVGSMHIGFSSSSSLERDNYCAI